MLVSPVSIGAVGAGGGGPAECKEHFVFGAWPTLLPPVGRERRSLRGVGGEAAVTRVNEGGSTFCYYRGVAEKNRGGVSGYQTRGAWFWFCRYRSVCIGGESGAVLGSKMYTRSPYSRHRVFVRIEKQYMTYPTRFSSREECQLAVHLEHFVPFRGPDKPSGVIAALFPPATSVWKVAPTSGQRSRDSLPGVLKRSQRNGAVWGRSPRPGHSVLTPTQLIDANTSRPLLLVASVEDAF